MNKKRIIKLLACFILNKEKRRNYRKREENKLKIKEIEAKYKDRYKKTLERLRKEAKHRKLKVCFIVSETCKWNLQSVYDAMEETDIFEPLMVVSTRLKYYTPEYYKHCFEFFQKRCKNTVKGFNEETKKSIDIKEFNPDIVFYQQPWDIFPNQNIDYVSDFALTCYSPYPVGETPETLIVNLEKFHYKLWKHFIAHKLLEKQYDRAFGYKKFNLVISGHPKLDTYSKKIETPTENYVIYSPHHALSFSWLKYSTFAWSGKYMLEWAKAHPEINWVFKPHPDLKRAVWFNEKLMSEEEIENYFKEWEKIALFYNDGDYFDLFKKSKCLITDCGSFITEYLPTEKPVIHLRSKTAAGYMDLNNEIMKHYYQAWDLKQLEEHLNNVILKDLDPMKEERLAVMKSLGLNKFNAGQNVINELRKEILR